MDKPVKLTAIGSVQRGTYCVNFHVVGLPSASTMILDKDCGAAAACDQG